MSKNFIYDALNDFGEISSSGDFPNVINMGEASIERMTVDIKLPDGPILTNVRLSILGSDSEDGTYKDIVTSGLIEADVINSEGYRLPVPKTKYKFIKASLGPGGISPGTVQAIINSYLGA
jgi:hypothetical protein